jgi:hypothetical protein
MLDKGKILTVETRGWYEHLRDEPATRRRRRWPEAERLIRQFLRGTRRARSRSTGRKPITRMTCWGARCRPSSIRASRQPSGDADANTDSFLSRQQDGLNGKHSRTITEQRSSGPLHVDLSDPVRLLDHMAWEPALAVRVNAEVRGLLRHAGRRSGARTGIGGQDRRAGSRAGQEDRVRLHPAGRRRRAVDE